LLEGAYNGTTTPVPAPSATLSASSAPVPAPSASHSHAPTAAASGSKKDSAWDMSGLFVALAAVTVVVGAVSFGIRAEAARRSDALLAGPLSSGRSRRGPRGAWATWEGFDGEDFNDMARLTDETSNRSQSRRGGGGGGGGAANPAEVWEVEQSLEMGPASGRKIYELEMERVALGRSAERDYSSDDYGV